MRVATTTRTATPPGEAVSPGDDVRTCAFGYCDLPVSRETDDADTCDTAGHYEGVHAHDFDHD